MTDVDLLATAAESIEREIARLEGKLAALREARDALKRVPGVEHRRPPASAAAELNGSAAPATTEGGGGELWRWMLEQESFLTSDAVRRWGAGRTKTIKKLLARGCATGELARELDPVWVAERRAGKRPYRYRAVRGPREPAGEPHAAPEEPAEAPPQPASTREPWWDLVEENDRLVGYTVRRYLHAGVPAEDLMQEGRMGLVYAARNWDPELGFKFSTYACMCIRGYILRGIDYRGRFQIAPKHTYGKNKELIKKPLSLDAEIGLGRVGKRRYTFADTIEDHRDGADPLACASSDERTNRVRLAVSELPRRTRAVLFARYGLGGGPPKTLNQIAAMFGISRERVRQIQTVAERKLALRLRELKPAETA